MTTLVEPRKFWERIIQEPSGCWVWTGAKNHDGYGTLRVGRRGSSPRLAHRVAFEISRGPIPAGACVLHRCDNPACCNPDHLWSGTQGDNHRDMCAKRRAWWHRLDDRNALMLRSYSAGTPVRELAAEHGLSTASVYRALQSARRCSR